MTTKELDTLSRKLRERKVHHLLLAQTEEGITLSSISTGDDMFEFLLVMLEQNDLMEEIMEEAIKASRNARIVKGQTPN